MNTEVQRRADFRGTLAFVVILLACGAQAGQGDLSVFLSRSSSFAQSLSLIAGRFGTRVVPPGDRHRDVVQQVSQSYAGLAYDAYYAGFFLQIGLGFGKGDFPNPNLALQCGYLFELR